MKRSRLFKNFGKVSYILSIAFLIAAVLTNLFPPTSAAARIPSADLQLNLSHIQCVDGQVEIHFVLLNVPDGITPGTLTYTYGTINPGAHTGNVWHYTAHVSDGYYDVESASVDVNGVTVSLHNPGDYKGTYNCSTTPPPVTICYNNQTMTVAVADLGQYPGYTAGSCQTPPPVTICYNNQTMTVAFADLGLYPGYTEGSCPPPPPVTICYNNVTMTVAVADLGNYPGYTEGSCPTVPPVTICYNGQTLTVPVADLGQYPGYTEGTCPLPPVTICYNNVTMTVALADLGNYPGYTAGACPIPEPAKVDVCHWTEGSHYNLLNVSVNSVANWLSGHGGHAEDIWASFTFDGTLIPAQGDQSILANGCVVPPPPPVTICYQNQTLTVPVADLEQYPGYMQGECPPLPKPVLVYCYSIFKDVFNVTIGNDATAGAGYIGYDDGSGIVSLGSLAAGSNAAQFTLPGTTGSVSLWVSLDGTNWTSAGSETFNQENQCEIDPVKLTNTCDPATGNIIWTFENQNPIAITFTWKWDGSSTSESGSVEANSSVTFTTASQTGTVIVSTSTGVVVALDAAAPCTFSDLTLKAVCAVDPTANNGWVITNPNTYPVNYEINKPDLSSPILGPVAVPGNSSLDIETLLSYGNIILLYSNGVLQDSATAAVDCIPGNPPENPPENPPQNPPLVPPVTQPRAVGGPTVLIPVTGLDMGAVSRQLPGAFTNIGLGFLGLGMVLSGMARRREE